MLNPFLFFTFDLAETLIVVHRQRKMLTFAFLLPIACIEFPSKSMRFGLEICERNWALEDIAFWGTSSQDNKS